MRRSGIGGSASLAPVAALLALAVLPETAFGRDVQAAPIALDLARDAATQAREAVRRGDFRIVRLIYNHEDSPGHAGYGQTTPGIACDGNISDAAAHDLPWDEGSASRFAAAYNAALVRDRRYPDRDVCVRTDADRRWPDFSRSGARPHFAGRSVNRAARAARPDLVRSLIAAGKPFDRHDRWQRRPLHWAARRGDTDSLHILLGAGAKPDADELVPPLLLAVESGHQDAVDLLLAAGASPFGCGVIDVRHSWGHTSTAGRRPCALRGALELGRADAVRALVSKAVAAATIEEFRWLVGDFDWAVESGRADLVEAFLEASGAARHRLFEPSLLRRAAYGLDGRMLRRLIAAGGGVAARSAAEERLWSAAAASRNPVPLALLIWFGGDLNYLTGAQRDEIASGVGPLTAARLRPYVIRAARQRELFWDAVLAGDLPALERMVASGVDVSERHGHTAVSRAASTDVSTVKWLLARGARADAPEEHLDFNCLTIADWTKASRAQRETFAELCAAGDYEPPLRPGPYFEPHALATAVRSGKFDIAELLLPKSNAVAAAEAIEGLTRRGAPVAPANRALLTRLTRLAASGERTGLAYQLRKLVENGDYDGASAMLDGYVPREEREISILLPPHGAEKQCDPRPLTFFRERGLPLARFRSWDGSNLFALAAECNSPQLVAAAAQVSGISVNAIDEQGRTALDHVAWSNREGPAAAALKALGAASCHDAYGVERCRGDRIEPDPSL